MLKNWHLPSILNVCRISVLFLYQHNHNYTAIVLATNLERVPWLPSRTVMEKMSSSEREDAQLAVARGGLAAEIGGRPALDLARELVDSEIQTHKYRELRWRKETYSNPRKKAIQEGDYVLVEVERGEHIGRVSKVRKSELSSQNLRSIVRSDIPEDRERMIKEHLSE